MKHRSDESLDLWEKAAVQYSYNRASTLDFHTSVYIPVIDSFLGDIKKRENLDAGCGDGWYTTRLTMMGAKVTGIDGSPEMIRLASQMNSDPNITYSVMNLTQPLSFKRDHLTLSLRIWS